MWKDNNDKIMEILDKLELKSNETFPVNCPICGKKEGHLYFHRYKLNDDKGGMWTWCSACCQSAHAMTRIPKWWSDLEEIGIEKLSNFPNYLEENKYILMSGLTS